MGQVHSGTRRVDGDAVAIKVLRPELAEDATTVTRFVQERSILLAINSPHVVRVHDLVVEGERLAIVMDLVEGADLRSHLNQHRNLPPAEAAGLVADILDGLAAIHAAGVVHRDLKPENVLLDLTGPRPVARVTDFGIARLSSGPTLTRMTGAMGTPEYLPPEVAAGSKSGAQADVYSAGIIAYELLAGRTPFAGGHLMAVLMRHREMRPTEPEGVPPGLWSVISLMLSKVPHERPSVSEARDALRAAAAHLDGVPRITPMPPPEETDDAPLTLDRVTSRGLVVDDDGPSTESTDPEKLTLPGIRTLPPIAAAEPETATDKRRRRPVGLAAAAAAAVVLISIVLAATLRSADDTDALSAAAANVTSTTLAVDAPPDGEPAAEPAVAEQDGASEEPVPAAAAQPSPPGTSQTQSPGTQPAQTNDEPTAPAPSAEPATTAAPTTAAPTTAAPTGPKATSMSASRTGDRQITAKWSVSPGSAAATCVLYFSGSAKWQGSCSGSMSKTISGLAYSKTYSIYAKATTTYGSSSTSTVSVRTNDAPPPPAAISLSKGAAAPYGYWYSVVLSNFSPGSKVTVSCHDSRDSNFYSQTFTIDSNGKASDSTLCYSGDGPEHWVTGGGVSSNRVSW